MPEDTRSILAVHEDSNSCAALFVDGNLDFAAAEERFSRIRFHAGRPEQTLDHIGKRCGLAPREIPVVVANRFSFLPSLPIRTVSHDDHDLFGLPHKAYLLYQEALANSAAVRTLSESFNRTVLSSRYPKMVHLADHHSCHAYSAYMTSGFEEATAITLDGFGDGSSGKIFRCSAGRCNELASCTPINSIGTYHAELAQVLGIDARLGGKVTGMAAYGDSTRAYPLVEQLVGLNETETGFELPSLRARCKRKSPYRDLAQLPMVDVAAAIQQRLEELVVPYVRTAVRETGIRDVVLAGGVFGNVKVTQAICAMQEVDRVFVHPAMNDHGIATGAGFEYLARTRDARPKPLLSPYLGTEYSDETCIAALDAAGLHYREEPDIDAKVAEILADGGLVARYTGRMEYGPRALGNRSILYRADDPAVNQWLNAMLRRKEYMPFAPVTLEDVGSQCYGDLSAVQECVRFMTIALPCTEYMRKTSPAAVHIDGTARPQVLRQRDNEHFYRILRLYWEKTGKPSLINTSFNMHEEPIVCTPADACRAFTASSIPFMAMNRFLVSAKAAETSTATQAERWAGAARAKSDGRASSAAN